MEETTTTPPTPVEPSPRTLLPLELLYLGQPEMPRHIYLIGAGGTGARVAALLPRMVRAEDSITVIDPDIVEERNLPRQHFIASDVGRHKAEVVAQRVTAALPPLTTNHSVIVRAVTEAFHPRQLLHPVRGMAHSNFLDLVILLGCVDNHEARLALNRYCAGAGHHIVYLDAGNATRTGQVILSFNAAALWGLPALRPRWEAAFPRPGRAADIRTREVFTLAHHRLAHITQSPAYTAMARSRFDGLAVFAPELLRPEAGEATPECRVRIDLQTVAANTLAATVMGSMLAEVLDGLPIMAPMATFGTNPPMVGIKPFPPTYIPR